ncbi:MAG: hypothetical protein DCC58_06805 [Chloroflexi bacterium]|nr:MAG: hypothetical protein DCC58_06805 [Chloroflexota bacterium]
MRLDCVSSHAAGNAAGGMLRLHLTPRQGERFGRTDEIWFRVPADFHTHNDSVAAAVLTLVGPRFSEVRFNFAISSYCAETLTRYYGLTTIGPVDAGMEPRRPGRHLALNFSGGVDSTALWVWLHDLAGLAFKVVTTHYTGSKLDEPGYRAYQRDITCETNLRKLHYDRAGRFHAAVPLLFADYLDLWGLTSAHCYEHYPYSMERLAGGAAPHFLVHDQALLAGGLAEVHIARCLLEFGLNRLLVAAAPQRIAAALDASDFPGSRKRAVKSLASRAYFAQLGQEAPAWLQSVPLPEPGSGRRTSTGLHFRMLWLAKHYGAAFAAQLDPRVAEVDLRCLDDMRFDFYERYNTNLIHLMPAPYRNALLAGLHTAGILPYDEVDFEELETVLTLIESQGNPRVVDHPML